MQAETSYFFPLPYPNLSLLLFESDMRVLLSSVLAKRQLIRSESTVVELSMVYLDRVDY